MPLRLAMLMRQKAADKAQADGPKKMRTRDRAARAYPAPEANAELQTNLDSKEPIQTWSGPLADPNGVGASMRQDKSGHIGDYLLSDSAIKRLDALDANVLMVEGPPTQVEPPPTIT
ncbi:hypothetical protein ACFE04_004279 [Oxalis oulophora]